MTTYNTQNPLGSSDPRDLYDNAENLDNFVNGAQPAYDDRLGQARKSWSGIEQDFADFLASSGYVGTGPGGEIEDYAAGIEITAYNQVIRDGGELWRAAAGTELPYTTTGAGMPEGGAFVSVGDAVLRQELAGTPVSGQGAALVNGATLYVGSVAELAGLPSPISGQEALVHGVPFKRINLTWTPSLGFVTPQVYGGNPASGVDNSAAINSALANNSKVYVPAGVWEIGSALRIPSNTTLEFHPSAELKLQDGASDYLITNDDLVNGNDSIRVIGNGATINGNKPGIQTRNYGAPADDRASYWGFGMWFSRVTNLVVDGFYVLETESWGVAYWDVTNGYFGNLRFWQTTEESTNGDGVTGVGSNILIENISGYTNDDMVFVGNGGGTLGGIDMGMADLPEVRNITIRNVTPEIRDGFATLRAIRLSGRSPDGGTTPGRVFDVTIENIKGYTKYQLVEIANFWQATAPGLVMYKVQISDLERVEYPADVDLTVSHIDINNVDIREISIDNWKASDSSEIPAFFRVQSGAFIEILKISNSEFRDSIPSGERALILDRGRIDQLVMSNCYGQRFNPTGGGNGRLYLKSSNSGRITKVAFSSSTVKRNYSSTNAPIAKTGTSIYSVNGTSDITNRADLTPDPGDVIVDSSDFRVKTWDGSTWA